MAEVGLSALCQDGARSDQEVLPAYSGKFSKHTFTQPQLMTILCLMRFEDWTFREAEVRPAGHSDLRAALGLERVPDHTTRYRFMRRVTDGTLDEVLGADSVIPAKRGKADWRIKGVRAQMRRRFPRRRYSQRVRVESVFSAVKRKLSSKAPGRTDETQRRQAMLLGVAYNIYLL
jgi:hypothetical protein